MKICHTKDFPISQRAVCLERILSSQCCCYKAAFLPTCAVINKANECSLAYKLLYGRKANRNEEMTTWQVALTKYRVPCDCVKISNKKTDLCWEKKHTPSPLVQAERQNGDLDVAKNPN